jgi:hypothetical protein
VAKFASVLRITAFTVGTTDCMLGGSSDATLHDDWDTFESRSWHGCAQSLKFICAIKDAGGTWVPQLYVRIPMPAEYTWHFGANGLPVSIAVTTSQYGVQPAPSSS